MLNEERIKLMTKMASYEANEGKRNVSIGSYFRGDYISLQVIKSIINATIAFAICFALFVFYDFEVFVHDWCITIINPVQKIMRVIANDVKALKRYYSQHKKEIWVGYNSRNYDTFIMKGLLLGMNPKEVNDDIIVIKLNVK